MSNKILYTNKQKGQKEYYIMVKINNFSIADHETWEGMECTAQSGTLLYKGRPVCTFLDEGNGGSMVIMDKADNFFDLAIKDLTTMFNRYGIIPEQLQQFSDLVIDGLVYVINQADQSYKAAKRWGKNNHHEELVFGVGLKRNEISNAFFFSCGITYEDAGEELSNSEGFQKQVGLFLIKANSRVLHITI